MPLLHHLKAELDRTRQQAQAIAKGLVGHLDLVCAPVFAMALLPRIISVFRTAHPGITVNLRSVATHKLNEMIHTGVADLGFGFLVSLHSAVRAESFGKGRLIAVMAKDHPLAAHQSIGPHDLADVPFIAYSEDQRLMPLVQSFFAQAGLRPREEISVGQIGTAWALVASGCGITIAEDLSGLYQIYPNVVMRPLHQNMALEGQILHPVERALSLNAQNFRRLFLEQTQNPQ